jgi:hypothetical protein
MQRNNRPAVVDGNGQGPDVVALPPNAAVNKERRPAHAWQSRINNDRPVYRTLPRLLALAWLRHQF